MQCQNRQVVKYTFFGLFLYSYVFPGLSQYDCLETIENDKLKNYYLSEMYICLAYEKNQLEQNSFAWW